METFGSTAEWMIRAIIVACLMVWSAYGKDDVAAHTCVSYARVCTINHTAALAEGFRREVAAEYQSTLIKGVPLGNTELKEGCAFEVFETSFAKILGSNPQLKLMASKDYKFAHEAGVFLEQSNEVFFTSNRLGDLSSPVDQYIELWKMNVATGALKQVVSDPVVPMANGGTNYKEGEVALCVQGLGSERPGGIVRLNPTTGEWSYIVNNWFGLQFNSPNDVIVDKSGAVWFTDPAYGFAQGFKPPPQLGNYVWRYLPGSGMPPQIVIAEGFERPNGLILSRDGNTLFVSDTSSVSGKDDEGFSVTRNHAIFAFDVEYLDHAVSLKNKRLFAVVDSGVPDGVKADKAGNLYVGAGDGVNVFSPKGVLIGKILVEGGAANLVFAGDGTLVILNERKVWAVKLATERAPVMG